MTILKKKASKKVTNKHSCHHCEEEHPDHSKEIVKLKRAKGQIEAITKMIDERVYCPDILIQVRAAKSALSSIEQSILKTHLESCVSDAIRHKDEDEALTKIDEIIKLIGRHQ